MQTYRAKALSGCRDRAWAHASTASGVETGCSSTGAAVTIRRQKSRQRRSVVYAYCPAPPTVWMKNYSLGFLPVLYYRSLYACCATLGQSNYILKGASSLAQYILKNSMNAIQISGANYACARGLLGDGRAGGCRRCLVAARRSLR